MTGRLLSRPPSGVLLAVGLILATGCAIAAQDLDAGTLPLQGQLEINGGSFTDFRPSVDTFDLASDAGLRVTEFPAIDIDWVTDGERLVPTIRTPVGTGHPLWMFIAEPGRLGPEADDGSRPVAFPFALRHANHGCVHYGIIEGALPGRHAEPAALDLHWRINAETCAYLKFDANGTLKASWTAGPVDAADDVLARDQALRQRAMPTRPLGALTERFPAFDAGAFAPPADADVTAYGLVVDGVHYLGDCLAHDGEKLACEHLPLPSYSTAKSLFAGLVYLRMLKLWPELATTAVTDLVPECRLADRRWRDVRLEHLMNMSTGLFTDPAHQADEASATMVTFFDAISNAERIEVACTAWPRAEAPGVTPVYHTSDHYLLGVALQRFLRQQRGDGADIHRDILLGEILAGVDAGPLTGFTERTKDTDAQPLTGYGLAFHVDDVARIGAALPDLARNGTLFPEDTYNELFFRNIEPSFVWPHGGGERYRHGWWAYDFGPALGCSTPSWVPFMAGYGGITWAFLPNQMVYYHFTDNGFTPWKQAVLQAHKARKLCD
ncbi:beta-lactamase family protein [Marinihelvus fidelis]|uniref:Beta-lactamase family protein n=1 Tax=Marinihelvus fidelis TaxID=2613842 RepID=A0A5N0TE24_9GAMM|nr:serine hydrolase [Marinihelvus fidelis]KAA9133230.1 beta-lactamase family protein [Marinihelvus fidelis]